MKGRPCEGWDEFPRYRVELSREEAEIRHHKGDQPS
jgi:hypothetical protein